MSSKSYITHGGNTYNIIDVCNQGNQDNQGSMIDSHSKGQHRKYIGIACRSLQPSASDCQMVNQCSEHQLIEAAGYDVNIILYYNSLNYPSWAHRCMMSQIYTLI